jgi:hypothetical protein
MHGLCQYQHITSEVYPLVDHCIHLWIITTMVFFWPLYSGDWKSMPMQNIYINFMYLEGIQFPHRPGQAGEGLAQSPCHVLEASKVLCL